MWTFCKGWLTLKGITIFNKNKGAGGVWGTTKRWLICYKLFRTHLSISYLKIIFLFCYKPTGFCCGGLPPHTILCGLSDHEIFEDLIRNSTTLSKLSNNCTWIMETISTLHIDCSPPPCLSYLNVNVISHFWVEAVILRIIQNFHKLATFHGQKFWQFWRCFSIRSTGEVLKSSISLGRKWADVLWHFCNICLLCMPRCEQNI